MAINWKAFYANGGYSNENSDPLSYDDGEDDEDENENENENLFTGICNPCEQDWTTNPYKKKSPDAKSGFCVHGDL